MDKRRRLPLLAWSAEIVYMTGDTNECAWTRACPAGAVLRDGDAIGEATYLQDCPRPSVTAQMQLTFADNSAARKVS
ncbi:MAG TPA: hypothetical protein VMV07_15640 [Streptosporangiaceae bacterium]|nr:hypothetical protein [Streptosporangiaceae bacterium]